MRRVAAGRWRTEQCVWFNRDNENHGLWKIRGRKMEEPWLLCAALTAMSPRGKLRCRRESRQERWTGSPKHHPKRWMSGWQWPLLRGGPRGIGEKTTPDFLNRWKTEEIAQHHWFYHDPPFPFFPFQESRRPNDSDGGSTRNTIGCTTQSAVSRNMFTRRRRRRILPDSALSSEMHQWGPPRRSGGGRPVPVGHPDRHRRFSVIRISSYIKWPHGS